MKYFIGVDGGGTKTAIAAAREDGTLIQILTSSGCSYQSMGVGAAVHFICKEIQNLMEQAGLSIKECEGCCIGMPCFGENEEIDKIIFDSLVEEMAPIPVYVVNDVEVGWAGSLKCGEGIHIVSGTGSIAFGRGQGECSARCGGWNEFYGDEGSCYWIGRQAMGVFTKEADGRLQKGALYEIVRQELEILHDYYFIDVMQERYVFSRPKVAEFQKYAYQAALEGDKAAICLYKAAAKELGALAKAVKSRLAFSVECIPVSYSGGLFRTGDLILEPLRQEIEELGCKLQPPYGDATEGACLLAIRKFGKRRE